jgi:EAL domain-containing protein (putative c-di-GMP-specific phosphodiesterase class I)
MAPLVPDQAARELAESLLSTIAAPIKLDELSLQADVSIGVVELDELHRRPEDLIRDADTAMYLAKSQGRNRIAVFDDALRRRTSRDSGLAQALRGALDRSELHLLYQPKVDLRTGLVAGFEALLRWESEQFGPVSPNEFIPLAEESGLIVPLGLWALRQACLQLRTWQETYPRLDHLTIAVNVSMRQLAHQSFLDDVVGIIEDSQIYPTALELELTESASMQDPDLAVALLGRLKDRGLRLALDDFGTGYSSLAHLRRLPVDVLKIDRAFVRGLESASDDSEIVRLVIALARALRIQCVAEGIETQANASEIKRLGCDLGQGHYFSKAIPVNEAGALLELNPAHFVG